MLTVVDETSKPLENFSELEIGDVFYNSESMLCIKITENTVFKYFESDCTWCNDYITDRYEAVTKVNATLVLGD
jgi:hypothetical protein